MKNWLNNILISPDSGYPIEYDEKANYFYEPKNQYTYEVKENVPVLLIQNALSNQLNSEKHQKQGTTFEYVEHYQKDAEVFDYFQEQPSQAAIHEISRIKESIIATSPTNANLILDVGCGSGWVAEHFCKKGKNVVSMDISLNNTKKVIKKYPLPNHAAILADVYALPFKENSFDCIIASEIIEHVPDPKSFVSNLIRVLKPGGSLIITTPYKEKIEMNLCIHCNHPTPKNAHLHSFDEVNITALFEKLNIRNIKWETFNNKALIKLHTHIVLKHLNYSLWRFIDKIANKMINIPYRILVKTTKG